MIQPANALRSDALITALRNPACYSHAVAHIEVLQTHISWVILTGDYAYKIKKPVDLGFLDFTSLEARRRYCEDELRLNRRLAPSLYETVVNITGSVECPVVDGGGSAIEYAVKMRQFPQSALASRLLAGGALRDAHIDALAGRVSDFHAATGIAAQGSPYGTPDAVIASARENFTQLAPLLPDTADQAQLATLQNWTEREYQNRWTTFGTRHAQGYVRECHGDLHLGNLVLLDGELVPFDCIEFNAALRWIDVMNEVAFLVMDLMDRGHADFAYRFLNAYLETSGDYAGLNVLRFYLVYRALVRAKVHALRAMQSGGGGSEQARLITAARGYLTLAQRCSENTMSAMIVMHGYSGSGKSVIAQAVTETLGAIRLRSDVERKRISGLAARERSGSGVAEGIYTKDLTAATYHRLLDLARHAIGAGYPAIVDATCLKRWQRDLFHREAEAQHIPFVIVDVTAPEATLRARIAARLRAGGDASEADLAVLTHQIAAHEPLTPEELAHSLPIDTARAEARMVQRDACATLRARLGMTNRRA